MLVLSIDTSLSAVQVGLWNSDAQTSLGKTEVMNRGQAERLIPLVQEVMRESGYGFAELSAVAVTRGPGSFTGVRVGLAAAHGLAMGYGTKVIGIGTADALYMTWLEQNGDNRDHPAVVLIDSRRDDVFAGLYNGQGDIPKTEEQMMILPPSEIRPFGGDYVIVGDGGALIPESDKPGMHVSNITLPDPVVIAHMAQQGYGSDVFNPLYLREADVTKPK
jgi:tRNA threonylcarbamoyladenosine biosynthesis protein TsaB